MSNKKLPDIKEKLLVELDPHEYFNYGTFKPIGEPFTVPTITTRVPHGKFEITYTSELFDVLKKLGNKKIEILSYLLDNKDGRNQLNMTNTEIALATNSSRTTVVEAMKILSSAGLIERKHSVLMISPNLMIKGNKLRHLRLLKEYIEMSDEAYKNYENSIDATVEEQYSLVNGNIVQKAK